ncbi:hypothetical protein CEE36_10560 [candidate division TA06 bacterium B3_TA06]|uniref:PEGA domain-containing protein n=1 Tax=candidate division TA06 bacterium B3_TA06 TaxID=2012487 RepID=A0A532UVR1_UNCT6|nr:MAG: hypothetical protein CEE36_10560 [candidate division TA06 bacterium B3_TA06]
MAKKILLAFLAFSMVVSFTGVIAVFTGCEEVPEEDTSNPADPVFPTDTTDTTGPSGPTGSIYVNSTPEGATVYIRKGLNDPDSATGKATNCVLEGLNLGSSYHIKLTLPGYHDWEAPVSLEIGQDDPVLNARLIAEDGSNIEVEAFAALTGYGYFIKYSYRFNVDVMLNSFTFKWPDYEPYFCKEFGFIYADDSITTAEYGIDSDGDGKPGDKRIPTGTHLLLIAGYDYYSEQDFCFELEVPCYPGQ